MPGNSYGHNHDNCVNNWNPDKVEGKDVKIVLNLRDGSSFYMYLEEEAEESGELVRQLNKCSNNKFRKSFRRLNKVHVKQ